MSSISVDYKVALVLVLDNFSVDYKVIFVYLIRGLLNGLPKNCLTGQGEI